MIIHSGQIKDFKAKRFACVLTHFWQDRYATGQTRPPIDAKQDWILLRGENVNGYTVLEFWRKWITCDESDRDILVSRTIDLAVKF